jgi:LacI family transcriptional regulator
MNVIRGMLKWARARKEVYFISESDRANLMSQDFLRRFHGFIGRVYGAEQEQLLRNSKLPAVNVSTGDMSVTLPRVATDDLAVGRMAAEYFLDKGYTDFAYAGMAKQDFSNLRKQGFVERLAAAGRSCHISPREDWFPTAGNPGQQQQEMNRDIGEWLSSLPHPIALFACNDIRACHMVYGCEAMGLRVPDQVAVLGVDNHEIMCDMRGIPMSSIRLPGEQVGTRAIELLLRMIEGKKPPKRPILLPPVDVITRRTTDILAIPDPHVQKVVGLIQRHFAEPLTVNDLVEGMSVSRRVLERLFRKYLGRSIRDEIEYVRLEQVKRMLSDTSMSMKEIAATVGFYDQRQLTVVFRKRLHITPTEYRKIRRS